MINHDQLMKVNLSDEKSMPPIACVIDQQLLASFARNSRFLSSLIFNWHSNF